MRPYKQTVNEMETVCQQKHSQRRDKLKKKMKNSQIYWKTIILYIRRYFIYTYLFRPNSMNITKRN